MASERFCAEPLCSIFQGLLHEDVIVAAWFECCNGSMIMGFPVLKHILHRQQSGARHGVPSLLKLREDAQAVFPALGEFCWAIGVELGNKPKVVI